MLYCTLSNSVSLFSAAKIRKHFQHYAIKHAKSGIFLRQPIAQKALLHKWRGGYLNSCFPHILPYFVKRKGALKRQFDNSKILFVLSVSSAW